MLFMLYFLIFIKVCFYLLNILFCLLQDEVTNTTSVQRNIIQVQTCSSNNINVWITIIVTWKTLFFSYGLFVAWKTRNVLLPPMKDSPSIVISVIFTMCWTSLAVVISSSLRHDPDAVYVLHILCITVCSIVVQISVFFPKVIVILKRIFIFFKHVYMYQCISTDSPVIAI